MCIYEMLQVIHMIDLLHFFIDIVHNMSKYKPKKEFKKAIGQGIRAPNYCLSRSSDVIGSNGIIYLSPFKEALL